MAVASLKARLGLDATEFTASLKRAETSAQRFLTQLAQQNQTFGMSADRARYYQLQLRGASKETLAMIDAQIKLKESLEKTSQSQQRMASGLVGMFGKRSPLGEMMTILRGGGAILALSKLTNMIDSVTNSMKRLESSMPKGMMSGFGTGTLAVFQNLPVIGGMFRAPFDQAGEDAKKMQSLIESQRKIGEIITEMSVKPRLTDEQLKTYEISERFNGIRRTANEIRAAMVEAGNNDIAKPLYDAAMRAIDFAEGIELSKKYGEELHEEWGKILEKERIVDETASSIVGQYRKMNDLIGMSEREKAIFELRDIGAKDADVNALNRIFDEIEAKEYLVEVEKRYQNMLDERAREEERLAESAMRNAESILDATRTESERAEKLRNEARAAMAEGLIDADTFARRMLQIDQGGQRAELPGTKLYGSQAAASAISHAIMNRNNDSNRRMERYLEEAKKIQAESRNELRAINQKLGSPWTGVGI